MAKATAKEIKKEIFEEPKRPTVMLVEEAPAMHIEDPIERQWKEESVKIKGVFQDNELKGGSIKFAFRKFPQDQIQDYHLFDGQEYELPLAVVKHLNSGCFYAQDAYVQGGLLGHDGRPMKNPHAKKFHRFSFKVSGYG